MYRAAFIRDPLIINSNGYDKLLLEIDDIPDEYNELVELLNRQYKEAKPYLDGLDNNFKIELQKNKDFLFENLDWYVQDEFTDMISNDQIDFYRNDTKYKNLVMRMSIRTRSLFSAIIWYRRAAIRSYFMIDDLLGSQSLETPDHIRKTTLSDNKHAESIVGKYKLLSGSSNSSYGTEFIITSEDKQLYIERNKEQPLLLHYWSPERLEFYSMSLEGIIVFSSEIPNRLTIINGGADKMEWEKVHQ